jgi:hypothetical protein
VGMHLTVHTATGLYILLHGVLKVICGCFLNNFAIMFFNFLKIIFDISTSKQSKTYKTY